MIDRLDKAFTEAELNELNDHVLGITNILKSKGVDLSPTERTKLVRPRKGSEETMRTLFSIAKDFGLSLDAHKVEDAEVDMTIKHQLSDVIVRLKAATQLANDTYSLARSEAWSAFLDYYAVLNAMALRNPSIATRMKAIVDFMAYGSRKEGDKEDTEATSDEEI